MTYSIVAKKISSGNAVTVRENAEIPAIMYGPKIDPVTLSIPYTEFDKLYAEAGEANFIDLSLDGAEAAKVLVQEVQHDPVKGRIIHVDFRQVDMTKEMNATIELDFVGMAPAVKKLGGTLMKSVDRLNIKCLPKDLVGQVDVDLSVLKSFDDAIHVSEVALPDGVVSTDNPTTLVAKVAAPLTEDQLKAMEESEAPTVDAVEVEEKGKKEEGGEDGDKKEEGAADKSAEKKE